MEVNAEFYNFQPRALLWLDTSYISMGGMGIFEVFQACQGTSISTIYCQGNMWQYNVFPNSPARLSGTLFLLAVFQQR